MTNLADELERLAKEATPGEWRVTEPWSGFSSLKAGEKLVFGLAAGCDEERRPASECDVNAALIVALRNALPEIVSALRAKPEGEPVWRERDLLALSASDAACYEYPGEDQAPLREAFVAGALSVTRPTAWPDREAVARAVCAHSVGGFCLNVGGHLGCVNGRGTAPDWRNCKADHDQLALSGNLGVADAILALPQAAGRPSND